MRRLCLHPTCTKDAEVGSRCRRHAKQTEQGIESRRQGRKVYNSKRWRVLRRRKLFTDPLCERCGEIATDVHHKKGVEEIPFDIEELESLCHECHSKETRAGQFA